MNEENYNHIKTGVNYSPLDFDLSIVSIDDNASPGELNKYVLETLGYTISDLKKTNLARGFALLSFKKSKPILFIVTLGNNNLAKTNLKRNLTNAITEYYNLLIGKKVWVPLMATGVAGMKYVDSYNTIFEVLKEFKRTSFTISIPNNKKGKDFISKFRTDNFQENEKKEPSTQIEQKPITSIKKKNDILLKNFTATFYGNQYFVAGHIWDGNNDQLPRFISDNIWENGHEKIGTRVVNTVKKHDIIFLKSAFQNKGISYLRIKAIGVVLENLNDGHKLEVKWHHRKPIDIKGLGKYRRTFARVMPDDIPKILAPIITEVPNLTEIVEVLKQNTENIKTVTTIAGLISDSDTGIDHLSISKDVTAFARVMNAKSFKPPLAIALLGKWGSGKSFFMNKVKERIQSLSRNDSKDIYCKGVAHIHFNAWSYMDSNLWAGIITKIFEGLKEYISNDSLANKEKDVIERDLIKQLNLTKDELFNLKTEQENIEKKIKDLNSDKINTEKKLSDSIKEINNKSLINIIEEVNTSYNLEDKVGEILVNDSNLNKIIPKEYWKNPNELYRKTKSAFTFIKTFLKAGNIYKNSIWLLATILLLFFMDNIFTFFKLNIPYDKVNWTIYSSSILFVARIFKTTKRLQPIITSLWEIKVDYELEKKNALFVFQQQEKSIKLNIEKYKNDIISISKEIKKAENESNEITYRLENAISTEALYSFIEKRAKSKDYKKHLGIVSIIRKDFEILSNLFTEHNTELDENKNSKAFIDRFDKPIERIILYVDDLDRCSHKRVVQVLEAVNLLMAFPLFVVVVGVDPRWVKNALIQKYKLQLGTTTQDVEDTEIVAPSNYLEKIFQIPFHLKDADDISIKSMLKTLAETKPELLDDENNFVNVIDDAENEKVDQSYDIEIGSNINTLITESIESLIISDKEIQAIEKMSSIIGSNPRSIKRFINIYRIIKAHEDFTYDEEKSESELLVILFLIALPIGNYKKMTKSFNEYILRDKNNKSIGPYFSDQEDSYYLDSEIKIDNQRLKQNLYSNIYQDKKALLNAPKGLFLEHFHFVKRFTFNY